MSPPFLQENDMKMKSSHRSNHGDPKVVPRSATFNAKKARGGAHQTHSRKSKSRG